MVDPSHKQKGLDDMAECRARFWHGKRVFLTGHTGFKGAWLALWLHQLGADIMGYSLSPPTQPNMYDVAAIGEIVQGTQSDIRDIKTLKETVKAFQPEIVFHLAAQALVRESYKDPLETFTTNIIGTANLLESLREIDTVRAIVVITTDKVYENREWVYPYREVDALGGYDPYSSSKAASEIVTASYRSSFFPSQGPVKIATARAGNVIGGGDWGKDRLVPDCLKAFAANEPVELRYPNAVRPWQHVLEPLYGYLELAEALCGPNGETYASPWNFGPESENHATVLHVAEGIAKLWGSGAKVKPIFNGSYRHEAGTLRLDTTLAHTSLGWAPRWSLAQCLLETVNWNRAWLAGENMQSFTLKQIDRYHGSKLT